MDDDVQDRLTEAAHAVAAAGLVDAFGHLSVRTAAGAFAITPPRPLGSLSTGSTLTSVPLDAAELPDGAPKEAWIHTALYDRRPGIGAVCRAQPPKLAAFAALGRELPALNGHAAMLGPVAVHHDSRLVRDAAGGAAVARSAGDADAIILLGNGAVTRGRDLAEAVARMWLLERTAELALRALAAGDPQTIPLDEQEWWRDRAAELLPRIYTHLANPEGKDLS
ncbi:class II aldolase/adducin family protein [Herbiconiux sp.]|uniref:class II aldolase/adducin family protein n=1 Tax=Herbiconiux sp. TaxID=1871186 RepID=UPI0025C4EEE9|nr:class II aldolase/adducin family protein [Herbiconiux sp.]